MQEVSKVIIHMVCSLDGFIAKKDGDISWMQSTDHYEKGEVLTDEDIVKYLERIGCYVMGSKTYEHALELGWPYGDKPVVVLTHRDLKSDKSNVEFHSGNLKKLVKQLKSKYENTWMVGGAHVTKEFLHLNLADEIIITVMPLILGDGIPFFNQIEQEHRLHLKEVTAFLDGMVEMTYEIDKGN